MSMIEKVSIYFGLIITVTGLAVVTQIVGSILYAMIPLSPILSTLGIASIFGVSAYFSLYGDFETKIKVTIIAFISGTFVITGGANIWIHAMAGIGLFICIAMILHSKLKTANHPLSQVFFNSGTLLLFPSAIGLFIYYEYDPAAIFHIHFGILAGLVVLGAVLWTISLSFWDENLCYPLDRE